MKLSFLCFKSEICPTLSGFKSFNNIGFSVHSSQIILHSVNIRFLGFVSNLVEFPTRISQELCGFLFLCYTTKRKRLRKFVELSKKAHTFFFLQKNDHKLLHYYFKSGKSNSLICMGKIIVVLI